MFLGLDIGNDFIKQYIEFLMFCYKLRSDKEAEKKFLQNLSQGRDIYQKERELIIKFSEANKISKPYFNAISSLKIDYWVYLKDARKYSLFLNHEASKAYAVQGLTHPIKDILGSSGWFIKTGIFVLNEQFVCDGLMKNHTKLGKEYRDDYNDIYKELKSTGQFYKTANL